MATITDFFTVIPGTYDNATGLYTFYTDNQDTVVFDNVSAALGIVQLASGIVAPFSATYISPQVNAALALFGAPLLIAKIQTDQDFGRPIGLGDMINLTVAGVTIGAVALGAGAITLPILGLAGALAAAWANKNSYSMDDLFRSISELTNSRFARALNNRYPRDPLALDLDGDGIETLGAADASAILFNHTGDNTANGSGWLKPDDGWLVLDRNGNGTIDDGSELFGVNTQKAPGVLATSGFDALSVLDGNSDCVFNSSDSQFANVRVWRDLNQDGVSQANELASLTDLTISAIGLAHDQERVDLGNGNARIGSGTFVHADGSVGHAYNLALQDNPFYRRFTDSIPLTQQAKTLPDMMGSGLVRDLREAASLPTVEGQDLASKLEAFAAMTSRTEQQAALGGLLHAWAKTARPEGDGSIMLDPNGGPVLHFPTGVIPAQGGTTGLLTLGGWGGVLEVFNGRDFITSFSSSSNGGSGR